MTMSARGHVLVPGPAGAHQADIRVRAADIVMYWPRARRNHPAFAPALAASKGVGLAAMPNRRRKAERPSRSFRRASRSRIAAEPFMATY